MKKKSPLKPKRTTTRSVLRLPDLEHAKTAVLNSLTSPDAQRGYRHAIDEFVDWYCSEPRLVLNRTVVLRYRSHLESRSRAKFRRGAGEPSKFASFGDPRHPRKIIHSVVDFRDRRSTYRRTGK